MVASQRKGVGQILPLSPQGFLFGGASETWWRVPTDFSIQYRPLVEQVELGGAEAADVQIM